MYSDKYNKYNKYKLTNVVKINEINYKLFFADEYKHVIIVSFTKKTTYFLFEVTHLSDLDNKFLIVNESCSKNLHTFFFKLRHHFNDNIDSRVVDEFILFLDLDSI